MFHKGIALAATLEFREKNPPKFSEKAYWPFIFYRRTDAF
jgi:hypothetical protein